MPRTGWDIFFTGQRDHVARAFSGLFTLVASLTAAASGQRVFNYNHNDGSRTSVTHIPLHLGHALISHTDLIFAQFVGISVYDKGARPIYRLIHVSDFDGLQ